MKAPVFSGAATDRLTVYEFEREWASYKAALNYSVDEALKELKVAVQAPARAAVGKMETEAAIFAYLRTHYGSPVLLLSAREEEIRAWTDCKGTDQVRREWLIHAKNRLESTISLCKDHKIEKYLHFSSVAGIVQSKLPYDMTRDFRKVLVKHLSPAGVLEKEIVLELLVAFIEEKILDCTLGVNLEVVNFLGADRPEEKKDAKQQSGGGGGQRQRGQARAHHQRGGGGGGNSAGGAKSNQASGISASPRLCIFCGADHPFLFYCEDYIKAKVGDRFNMAKDQQSCVRCLTMGRKFSGPKKDWWQDHEKYCKTVHVCAQGFCAKKPRMKQLHVTLCFTHATENRKFEPDFFKSLDAAELPSGFTPSNVRFLLMSVHHSSLQQVQARSEAAVMDEDGYELIPHVEGTAIFMLQTLPAETDPTETLLCFYDSGCGAAGISDRAYQLLRTTTVRKGPTVLDVAGAKTITVPHGDEQFYIELCGPKQKATVTGLRMAHITSTFPFYQLNEAWEELNMAAMQMHPKITIPKADAEVGGRSVDIILGSRYLKYYPELVLDLPSGLSVYKARLKSASGCQAVLGGPHMAWFEAATKAQHMNPRAYLTSEARAWYIEQKWVHLNQDKLSSLGKFTMEEADISGSALGGQQAADSGCLHCHCTEEVGDQTGYYSAAMEERQLWTVEELGTESPYRCVACRNCAQCKNGDTLEAISFKEEAEQALIEDSIELDVENNLVWARLPFVEDPVAGLKPNRFIAEKVFKSQLELFRKNPAMREDTLKSHQKLADKGHVLAEVDLPEDHKRAYNDTPGEGCFIPWRTVYNEGSLSTPCRMVFDASSKTPGGNSLNGALAKGQNRLSKLQHLLIRFRRGRAAVTADISMAYNGMKLKPEHLKYQKYLWKEGLLPENPTIVMVVATLIYGVKPSGQQCQVSLERLADHHVKEGRCLDGAQVLRDDTYVDDILTSKDSIEDCVKVGSDIVEILAKGSMGIKALSFSGVKPDEKVTADGRHVGLAGYLWDTEADKILLDIGPPRLGRAKRGKRPVPVAGDLKAALASSFTKRILTGLVASVFDPLGLVTPVTAGLKLDLHELCLLKLDWDDPVPPSPTR
jgi:hypothetical protein